MLVAMLSTLNVNAQATPNPNAVKFTLNRPVASQGKTYRDAATADTAWAKQLLAIPGIVQLFAVNDFISVSKAPEADWAGLVPQIEAVLRQTFA